MNCALSLVILSFHLFSFVSIFMDWQKLRCVWTFEFLYLQMTSLVIYAFRCALNFVVWLNPNCTFVNFFYLSLGWKAKGLCDLFFCYKDNYLLFIQNHYCWSNYQEGCDPINWLSLPHLCACPKQKTDKKNLQMYNLK
jgi:hypothetical protein